VTSDGGITGTESRTETTGTMGATGTTGTTGATGMRAHDDENALPGVARDGQELRQRVCFELLLREARRVGLLADGDPFGSDGALSESAAEAIEALLDRVLQPVEPDEEACRRHYAAHASRFGTGERVHARHILFAVTPGVDVPALTAHAERLLLDLRRAVDRDEAFARAARANSNCPSGAHGGDLGWIRATDCAPEFAREVFGRPDTGLLPRLVRSRFGLHVVDVMARDVGGQPVWDEVREAVAQSLRRQSWATSLGRYLDELGARSGAEEEIASRAGRITKLAAETWEGWCVR